jgi:membrane protein implicated in regulation of membrane protease activity
MVDWLGVATNSVWILGLALVLAVLSYADWSAHTTRQRLREVLGQAAFRVALWSGLTLFCAGVAFSGGCWWEGVLWGVLAVMAAVKVWRARLIFSTKEHKDF